MADGFGALLRRHRTAAVLTQERLAELAGISATGIAALESGRRRAPRPSTVALLLDALGLQGDARAELIAAAASDGATAAPGRVDTAAARTMSAGARAATGILGDTPNLAPRATFVGRPDERARLLEAWQRRTRVVVVAGEAGVGKTRLVSELARALDPEATVLWGRCTPDRLGVYEPFVGPLREVLRRAPDGGERVGDLARLVPELVNERGWADATRSADPDVERRLLFEAAGALLADLGPTLLVLDDMHWADTGSLALLGHLAARAVLDVVIVVTVRTTDQDAANAAALAELRRHATIERLTLHGLGRGDVAALVGELAGDRTSRELVDAVVGATEGNPLFVEELTEHLVALGFGGDGADDAPATSLPVPTGVRETLTQRLATLSPDAQSLLRTGAVLGRTFDADLAAGLADLPPTHVLGATEDALLSRLVTEHSARELSFSHGLVQLAVYETTSARRRLDLHRRAAETLAAADGSAPLPDAVVFAVARHWETVARSDPSASASASAWCRRAGDAAAAAADIGEAIVRYERAVRLGAGSAGEQCETLLRLGAALSARSRWEEADDRFRAALSLADERRDPLHAARAAIGLASTVRYGHSDPERIAALERALADLPDGEEVLRTMAAAMLKRQLGFDLSDDAYRRRQAAARIVLDAVSRDDLSTELLLTLGQARDAITVDDPRVLARLSRRTVAAATAERKLQVLAHGWFGQAWAAFELADGPAWTEATAAFDAVAHELDLPFELGMASTMAATTALMHGRYVDAERLSEQAFSLSSGADPNAPTIHLTAGVIRGVDLGHGRDMVELMAASRAELALVPTFMAGFTAVAALAGATDLARELLDEHARVGFAHVRRDLEWLPVMGFLCHAAAVVGAVEHAPELHDLLEQHPARAVRVGPLAGWWGPTDHHLGALCRVMGRLAEAEERLRRAVATCDDLGARPWAARCRLELARIVEMRAGTETTEVAELRADAARTVAEIGAKGVSLA